MISVIIPVYKNQDLFLKNLIFNLPLLPAHQLIVVNDDPDSNLTSIVKKHDSNSVVINNLVNVGFAKSMNIAVQSAKNELLLFLNSDVRLKKTNWNQAITMFKDPKLFALSFAQIEKDGHITGANKMEFKNGLYHHFERNSQTLSPNSWPEGGASLLKRSIFAELHGFDEIYSPFYWEDVDLGFRALKKGYRILFYPQILVEHHHQTTINKYFSPKKIQTIAHCNQFLFMWKNIKGPYLFIHLLYLPILLIKQRHNPSFWQGFKKALFKFFLNK